MSYLNNLIEHPTDKAVIEIYFQGLNNSIYEKQSPDNIKFVEKSFETDLFTVESYSMYQKTKFIHIIKNSFSNIVSSLIYKSHQKEYLLINRILNSFYYDYYFLFRNSTLLDNYLIVLNEDPFTKQKTQITRIAVHLEIKSNNIPLKPTHLGDTWKVNSMTAKNFIGVDPSRLPSWKDEIHNVEVPYINYNLLTLKMNKLKRRYMTFLTLIYRIF